MLKSLILILDDRPQTELFIRRLFEAQPIMIRQVSTRQEALLIADEIQALLVSTDLASEDAYELASDLSIYYPTAALYFLVADEYNSVAANEAGSLGAFNYPLQSTIIKESLLPFLNLEFHTDENTLSSMSSVLRFNESSQNEQDLDFNAELEQLIKLQLMTNINIRRVIRQLVIEFTNESGNQESS